MPPILVLSHLPAPVWTLAQYGSQSNDGSGAVAAFFGGLLALFCGSLFFLFLIEVVIAWMGTKLLKALPPEFRKQEPNMVWLLLIPIFNLVWNFFVWPKISESYEAYFAAQGRTDVGNANGSLAWAFCICMAVALIPYVGWFCLSFCAMVVLVIYLVKMFGLKAQVIAPTGDAA